MKILQYRGVSIISKGIQLQTRSPYSHSAIMLDDGSVIEAWHKGGVRHLRDPFEGHDDKTVIDVYEIQADFNENVTMAFLRGQLGKKYDFRSVIRFLTRLRSRDNDKWFCSELVVEALRAGGLTLLRGHSSMFSPRDVAMSPYLFKTETLRKEK